MTPGNYKPVLTISTGTRAYQKGAPGSFDASYFTDPSTGKFRFPDYNQDRQGLVRIKDNTNYKKSYFSGRSQKERDAFTLDDFELHFRYPDLIIETFQDFFNRFPEASFNKGMSREEVFDLFYAMRYYTTDQSEMVQEVYYWTPEDVGAAIELGLLAQIDTETDTAKHWSNFTINELKDLCMEYGVKPGSSKKVCVSRLMDANITFPYIAFVPTPLLKETYWSFVDLYINDIKEQARRFHPLYLEHLWQAVTKQCDDRGARQQAGNMYAEPYWTSQLLPTTKKRSNFLNDDNDDE